MQGPGRPRNNGNAPTRARDRRVQDASRLRAQSHRLQTPSIVAHASAPVMTSLDRIFMLALALGCATACSATAPLPAWPAGPSLRRLLADTFQLNVNTTAVAAELPGEVVSKCRWTDGKFCDFNLPFALSVPATVVDDASRWDEVARCGRSRATRSAARPTTGQSSRLLASRLLARLLGSRPV